MDAIIFDLDGVVTDTAEYHYVAWKRLADEIGVPFDRQRNEALRGVSRMESLRLLLDGAAFDEEALAEMADRKNRYYRQYVEGMGPQDLLPGARALLDACRARGLAVAVASSSRNARRVLELLEITDLFDAVTDGDSVEKAKPAPDLFLHAARQLGAEPSRCAVVEDAEVGVDAALAGGMFAVGIGPPERVGHAHLRFDSTADVDLAQVLALETTP